MTIDSVTATHQTTAIQYTGYFYNPIRQTLEQGKIAPEVEEARIQRILEEERKRIQPIYNAKGKIIEYRKSGRYLNIFV